MAPTDTRAPSARFLPLGAGITAVTTLLSCLPLGAATALGAVALSAALTPYRWWLVGLSAVLVSAGFVQVFRQPRERRRVGTIVLLSISLTLVLLVVLANVVPH